MGRRKREKVEWEWENGGRESKIRTHECSLLHCLQVLQLSPYIPVLYAASSFAIGKDGEMEGGREGGRERERGREREGRGREEREREGEREGYES